MLSINWWVLVNSTGKIFPIKKKKVGNVGQKINGFAQVAISNTQKENYSGQHVFLLWEILMDVFKIIVNYSYKESFYGK